MASWKEERDRLVAQTLAFVQHVASAHPAAANKIGLSSRATSADAHAASVTSAAESIALPETIAESDATAEPATNAPTPGIQIAAEPTDIVADLPKRSTQYAAVSERSDISQRVAAFKARQMTLDRERADYYDSVQARIRSSLRNDNGSDRL